MSIDGDTVGQTWLLGARYVSEDVDYRVDRQSLATGNTSVFRDWQFDNDAKAFYLSNAISLLDRRLTITPGVRYENATMDYSDAVTGFKRTNKAKEWLPGLTIGYQATDEWFVYANAQRSLRPPQVTQIVKEGAVDSEIAWNYETGVRYTPRENLRVDFGLYRIDFDDQIEYNASTDRFVNLGSTRHQGFETEVFWSPEAIRGLELHAGYAFRVHRAFLDDLRDLWRTQGTLGVGIDEPFIGGLVADGQAWQPRLPRHSIFVRLAAAVDLHRSIRCGGPCG